MDYICSLPAIWTFFFHKQRCLFSGLNFLLFRMTICACTASKHGWLPQLSRYVDVNSFELNAAHVSFSNTNMYFQGLHFYVNPMLLQLLLFRLQFPLLKALIFILKALIRSLQSIWWWWWWSCTGLSFLCWECLCSCLHIFFATASHWKWWRNDLLISFNNVYEFCQVSYFAAFVITEIHSSYFPISAVGEVYICSSISLLPSWTKTIFQS